MVWEALLCNVRETPTCTPKLVPDPRSAGGFEGREGWVQSKLQIKPNARPIRALPPPVVGGARSSSSSGGSGRLMIADKTSAGKGGTKKGTFKALPAPKS